MNNPLLATKLHMPRLRRSLVSRDRLIERMAQGLHRQLTLVSAPAGFGKTTLVSMWLDHSAAQAGSFVCWLSLDEQDNVPARFLSYVVGALQTAVPAAGHTLTAMLQAPQLPPIHTLIGSLINDLSVNSTGGEAPLILVLDDYHLITEPFIHEAVTFLLEHQPPNLHLVLATREDPPLPLPRLRVRNQLNELRIADLRFKMAETAVFLNQMMGLQLDESDVAALEQRTEGWIAGLQLVALSMQRSDDLHQFITSFTGSTRYILDYLIEEVFQQQPGEIQQFLLKTAVLPRFNAALCDAVTKRTNSARMLNQLEQANLFLMPLDEARTWYRYHRLFADLLRQRLRALGMETAVFHQRAGEWFQTHEMPMDAVPHLLAAQAWESAAAAIDELSDRLLRHGEAKILLDWLQQLPPAILRQQPALALELSWALILIGQLDAAETSLQNLADNAQEIPIFLGQIKSAQAHIARARYDVPRTIALSEEALALLPQEQLSTRSVLTLNLGIAHWSAGNAVEAEQVLIEARFLAEQTRNHYAFGMAVGFLALAQAAQGKLHQAADLLQAAIEGKEPNPTHALAHRVLSGLYVEWNDPDAAVTHLHQAEALAQAIGNIDLLGGIYRAWVYLKQVQGDEAGALAALTQAHQLAAAHDLPLFHHACNAAAHVWAALAQGDMETAVYWCEQMPEPADASPFFPRLNLSPVRLLLAQGQKTAVLTQLVPLLAQAEQFNWQWGVIEIRTLQALAAADHEAALHFLGQALTLAAPSGYIRTFIDKGDQMAALLRKAADENIEPEYVSKLLTHFATPQPETITPSPKQPQVAHPITSSPLIDPLSDREREILQLLADRQTNAEIAARLVVSVNTVKTHLQHIYEKLGVHNRRTAVSQAVELNLL